MTNLFVMNGVCVQPAPNSLEVHVLKYDVAMSIWTCYICPLRQCTLGIAIRISTFKSATIRKLSCSIFEKNVYDGTSLILYLSTTAFETSESGKMVSGDIGSSSIQ